MVNMPRFVLPRVTKGNRGDIASRWGLLRGLQKAGVREAVVYYNLPKDIPMPALSSFQYLPLGKSRFNLAVRRANTVVLVIGVDLQVNISLLNPNFLLDRFW